MNLKLALPAAALAVGLLGIGFGTAEALSTTAIPPNTIHGCVVGKNRTLEQVYSNNASGTACALGQQVVFPKGATTAGPTGLDVEIVTAATGTDNHVAAYCPADHPYVVGGGFENPTYGEIEANFPTQHGGATGQQQGWILADAGPPTTAYALCAK